VDSQFNGSRFVTGRILAGAAPETGGIACPQPLNREPVNPESWPWNPFRGGSSLTHNMRLVVISDLHIGCRFCRAQHFLEWLPRLPHDAALVLNGDTVDNPRTAATDEARQLLDALAEESRKRPVVWLWGNHDDDFRPENAGAITFAASHAVGKRLFIAHGYDFDNVMPRHQGFIRAFRWLHRQRMRFGAPPVHVAHYAKKWRRLYDYLRSSVRQNAIEYAREAGFEAVACGHVHFAEQAAVDGIRYFNTGAWTEDAAHCLLVDETEMTLQETAKLPQPDP